MTHLSQGRSQLRRGFAAMLLACPLIVGLLTAAGAQPPLNPDPPPRQPPATTARIPKSANIIYIQDETGEYFPALVFGSPEEFFELRRAQQEQAAAQAAPEFSVESIALAGTATEEYAELKTTIQLQVLKGDKPVKVPLGLNEAVLKDVHYVGQGKYTFAGQDQKTGYSWWISGEGRHELQLVLSVPVRKQLQVRRFQLSLPRTAVSSLELTVDLPRASFKIPEKATPIPTEQQQSTSSISLFGLGERLDLSWQPEPEQQPETTQLQAETSIRAGFTANSVLLKASQQVTAARGNFRSIVVRLPEKYTNQNLKISGNQLEGISTVPNRPGWYRVQLSEPTSGPVTLDWVLERDLPASGETFAVEGFEIEGNVTQQTGVIALEDLPGYHLIERDLPGLFRRNVQRREDSQQVTLAYEFYKQPFTLNVEVQKVTPIYSVSPRLQLRFDEDSVDLTATYRVDVYRGQLEQLEFEWDQWKESGWRLEPGDQQGLIESLAPAANRPSRLTARFYEPQAQSFTLALHARQPLSAGGEPKLLTLPRTAETNAAEQTAVRIEAPENLDVAITNLTDPVSAVDVPPAPDFADLFRLQKEYQFSSLQPIRMTASVIPRERVVSTRTELALDEAAEDDHLLVEQRIHYDVSYERLPQLRLRLPAGLDRQSLRILDERGEPLEAVTVQSALESAQDLAVTPRQSQRRAFAIRILYETSINGGLDETATGARLQLPVIQSADAEFSRTQLVLRNDLQDWLAPAGNEWKLDRRFDDEAESFTWAGPTSPSTVGLVQKELLASERGQLTVTRCLMLSSLSADGRAVVRTRGLYRLTGSAPTLDVEVPPGYRFDEASLDGRPLQPDGELTAEDRTLTFRISRASQRRQSRLLELDLRWEDAQAPGGNWQPSFQPPRLVNARRVDQTYWLVELPYNSHLFTLPKNYSPQFRWQQSGMVWTRVPTHNAAGLAEWIDADAERIDDLLAAHGNVYLFHSSDAPRELRFRTIGKSAFMLIGGGIVLILAVVLLNLSATRNVLTFLLLAMALAVCGIWYPTAIALLIQPAAFGFLLAVMAALVDRIVRRRAAAPIITLEELHAAESPHGSSMIISAQEHQPQPGSEEPTQVRSRPVSQHETLSSYLTGSD